MQASLHLLSHRPQKDQVLPSQCVRLRKYLAALMLGLEHFLAELFLSQIVHPPHPSVLFEDAGALFLLRSPLGVQRRPIFCLINAAFVDGGGSLL